MWKDFILFVAVGFAAQLADGAIGMAYGLSATTVMLGRARRRRPNPSLAPLVSMVIVRLSGERPAKRHKIEVRAD